MKRILAIFLITLFAFAAVAAPGRGRGAEQRRPDHRGPGELLAPGALADFLDLTEAQIAQIQPLRDAHRAAVEPLRDQQRANRDQIRAAVEAGNAAQAGALLIANHGLAQQIDAAQESFETSFTAVLTAAQKAKYDVYRELLALRR